MKLYEAAVATRQALLNENARLRDEWTETNRKLRIADLKNASSLANNLCPDHRDKQHGKLCLACEIERLQKRITELERGGAGGVA